MGRRLHSLANQVAVGSKRVYGQVSWQVGNSSDSSARYLLKQRGSRLGFRTGRAGRRLSAFTAGRQWHSLAGEGAVEVGGFSARFRV